MNASSETRSADQPRTKPSASFWLQSTLGDYEVEEVNMWELAGLLAQTQHATDEPEKSAEPVGS
jgi:hypothetical protein